MIFVSITLNVILALTIFLLIRRYQKIVKAILQEQDEEHKNNAAKLLAFQNEMQRTQVQAMMNLISPLAFAKKIKGNSN